MKVASLQITPTSVSAFRQSLTAASHRVVNAANNSLDFAASMAFSQAQDRVPRVTGALANSGKVVKQNTASLLRRVIGYGDSSLNPRTGRATSTYAMNVHEVYRAAHPDSYKWLELTIRQYGREAFLHDLALNIRAAL
jgi:hypothetical protein